jgi:enoyl-CoA hydratase/carnithine racemase
MGRRLRLTIRNAHGQARLDRDLVEQLIAALAEDVQGVTMITVESDSHAFCEGMDLEAFSGSGADIGAALERFGGLLRALEASPRPVVAIVGGPAMGGGVGLAAVADVVLASPNATFTLPETLFGMFPATIYPFIARRLGHARARWLSLGAAGLDAHEAWRIGLVDVIDDDLEGAVERLKRRFECADPRALAAVKASARTFATAPADYPAEAAASMRALLSSQGTRERIQRFLGGRSPWPDDDSP